MKDWCWRTVRAWGSGVTLRDELALEGSSVVKVRMASTSVLRGKARVASRAMVERESSSLKVPCLRWVRVSATPWASRRKKLGGVDEDGSAGVFRLDLEAVEDGLGEGLADGELLGGVSGGGAEGLVGLDEEDFGAGALEADDDAFGDLAAVEAEVVGAGAVGQGVGVEEVVAAAARVDGNLEVELAGFGVPVEGEEADHALHIGCARGDCGERSGRRGRSRRRLLGQERQSSKQDSREERQGAHAFL